MKKILKTILGNKITTYINLARISFEPKNIISKRKRFYAQFIKKGDLVFDVGANVGNRIDPLLGIGSKVVAIEPQKNCIHFLKWRFGSRIEIVQMGAGASEEVKDFFVSNESTISSFSTDWIEAVKNNRFNKFHWNNPIKVQITTLDKLIQKYGVPNFIKIDVEGYELEVLQGLSHPVEMVSFEYTVPECTETAIACISQIEKNNPDIECNYSIGESMEFANEHWQIAQDFKEFLSSPEFSSSGFGDIYVRKIAPR